MWSVYLQFFVLLAVGIYLGDRVSAGDAVIFILALVLSSVFRKIVLKKFFSFKVLAVVMAAAGILLYHYHISESVRPAYSLHEKYITMLGKVTELPRREQDNNIYIVDVRLMNYLDKNYEVHELIRVTSPEIFDFGDSVRIEGFLKTFPKKLNGGDFDSGRNYKAKGIYFKTYAEEMELCSTNFKCYSLSYFFTRLKSLISERIYDRYEGDTAAVLKAVMTGYKDSFSESFEEELYESNTMRLFYPAYMHIAFIIMLVGLLSAYVSKSKRDVILIVMLVLYAAANFNSHYIVKSAVLAAAVVYSKYKIGFANYIDVLALTAGIMLAINPLIGYETGFILSVTANLLIFYFVPAVSERLKKVRNHKTRNFLSVWIVLSAGMLPMQAYFFYVTTPYAFLMNFIYMPFLSLLWVFAPLNLILPVSGSLFSWIIEGIAFFMQNIPGIVSELPGYKMSVPRPGILTIAVFYLLLYVLRCRFYRRRKNDFSMQFVCAVIIGFTITGLWSFIEKADDMEINFVNVGQGDGAVLSIPFHETVIIDGGGSSEYSDYDYGKEIFLPYLKREGHNKIDLAVVSHYHSDHCKGVIAAMKKLEVKEVLIPDCMGENKYRKEIEFIAEQKDIKLSYFKAGARLKFTSGMIFDIVSPDEAELVSENENDTSFGIRVSYGKFSALFTGDISEEVEKKHKGKWRDCSVLKVGHHGSLSSSSEDFIDETAPEAAVISVGENNSYGLPKDEVILRYMERNIPVYRTDLYGDITVLADKDGSFKVSSFYES